MKPLGCVQRCVVVPCTCCGAPSPRLTAHGLSPSVPDCHHAAQPRRVHRTGAAGHEDDAGGSKPHGCCPCGDVERAGGSRAGQVRGMLWVSWGAPPESLASPCWGAGILPHKTPSPLNCCVWLCGGESWWPYRTQSKSKDHREPACLSLWPGGPSVLFPSSSSVCCFLACSLPSCSDVSAPSAPPGSRTEHLGHLLYCSLPPLLTLNSLPPTCGAQSTL